MTREEALKLDPGNGVIYDPGYKEPETGFVTSIQVDDDGPRVFVCYDGTGRGQLTPFKDLR